MTLVATPHGTVCSTQTNSPTRTRVTKQWLGGDYASLHTSLI